MSGLFPGTSIMVQVKVNLIFRQQSGATKYCEVADLAGIVQATITLESEAKDDPRAWLVVVESPGVHGSARTNWVSDLRKAKKQANDMAKTLFAAYVAHCVEAVTVQTVPRPLGLEPPLRR